MREKRGMKRWFLFGVLVLSLAGLVGCGGGGDESTAILSGFTKTVTQGGAAEDVPLFDNVTQSRIQVLVLAEEIQGAGFATSLSFRFKGASAGNSIDNLTIKLAHASITNDNLSATFANNRNTVGSQVTVFGPQALPIPTGADNATLTIPLNGKFNYNGVDDLLIEFTAGKATKQTIVYGHLTSPQRNAVVYIDNLAVATGVIDFSLPDMKIHFTGGVNQFDRPGGSALFPFTPNTDYQKTQMFYTAKDIDGSGFITGIAFKVAANSNSTDNDCRYSVRIGHLKAGKLTTGFDNNFTGAPVVAADNVRMTYDSAYPADGGWLWVPVTKSFHYNGTDNLVVEIKVSEYKDAGGIIFERDTSGGAETFLIGRFIDNTGSLTAFPGRRFSTKFRFAGGTVDVNTPAWGTEDVTFPGTGSADNSTNQYKYRATELGSAGTVTKIAFRLLDDGVAASYTGFKVKLALSDNATFGSSLSANVAGGTEVFSGTVDISTSLKSGDYIEIPLSTPFKYDPRKSLVVQTFTKAGAADNFLKATGSSEFTSRHGFQYNTVSDTANVNSWLQDLRLTVQ